MVSLDDLPLRPQVRVARVYDSVRRPDGTITIEPHERFGPGRLVTLGPTGSF